MAAQLGAANMLPPGILQAIANPQTADVFGAFQKGRVGALDRKQKRQDLEFKPLEYALDKYKADTNRYKANTAAQTAGTADQKELYKSVAITLSAAMAEGDPEKQKGLLLQGADTMTKVNKKVGEGLRAAAEQSPDEMYKRMGTTLEAIYAGGYMTVKKDDRPDAQILLEKAQELEKKDQPRESDKYEKAAGGYFPEAGKLDSGFRWNKDRSRQEAIPGSKAYIAQQSVITKMATKYQSASNKFDLANNLINEIKKDAKGYKVGMWGKGTSKIWGGKAHDLANRISTLKAILGFDKLGEMRDMSETGGALGQVSEKELTFLQDAVAAMSQSQGEEELQKNLEIVRTAFTQFRDSIHQAVEEEGKFAYEVEPKRFWSYSRREAEKAKIEEMKKAAMLKESGANAPPGSTVLTFDSQGNLVQ